MLKATKKNRVVRIPDEKAEEYKQLGYTVTDMDGKVVCKPEDKDAVIEALRAENKQLKQKVAALEKAGTAPKDQGPSTQPQTPQAPSTPPGSEKPENKGK